MNERALRVAGVVLIAVVGVWAGVRIHASRSAAIQPLAVSTPVGMASPPTASDLVDESAPPSVKIPDRLPAFSLAGLDGKPTPISDWSGKSLVINFWATWCTPCRHEIPLLEGLAGEWAGRGIQVIGIAVDHRDQVARFAQALKIGYPLLIGEQDALDVASALGFASPVFPFTVFTDRRGEVVALYVGELRKPQADLILSTVQNLNRDQLRLAEARRLIADGLRLLAPKQQG